MMRCKLIIRSEAINDKDRLRYRTRIIDGKRKREGERGNKHCFMEKKNAHEDFFFIFSKGLLMKSFGGFSLYIVIH